MLDREERARIFLPFDALSGLRQALKEKEIENEIEYEGKRKLFKESYFKITNDGLINK